MTKPILELEDVKTTVKTADGEIVSILKGVDLGIKARDFITIIGANRAGKSTLLNIIAGSLRSNSGFLLHNGPDTTKMGEEERTQFIGRVFQDPKLRTAPRMTVAGNLLLATKRGKRRFLRIRKLKQNLPRFKKSVAVMNNGLEDRLNISVEGLSGGRRQALSFLTTMIKRPDILLLDEHAAALNPHTSRSLLAVADQQTKEGKLTALIITHHMEDVLKYGDRLLVLKGGKVKVDINERGKQNLRVGDPCECFED